MRLIILLLLVIAVWIIWYVRRVQARRRLEEIDRGARCLACNATDLSVRGDQVLCLRCGTTASLAALARTHVSDDEIRNLTSPD
jgi:hypothetical protein